MNVIYHIILSWWELLKTWYHGEDQGEKINNYSF